MEEEWWNSFTPGGYNPLNPKTATDNKFKTYGVMQSDVNPDGAGSANPAEGIMGAGMSLLGNAAGGVLGSLATGGLSTLGSIAGQGIAGLFGADKTSAQKAAMQNALDMQEKSIQNEIKYQEAKNLASQTNSLGMTGQAAALDAQRAMDKNGPTADAMSAARNMTAQANSGLMGAQSQANLARITGQQQANTMMANARAMSGGNPASAMALMGKIGDQLGANNLQALQAGNDALQRANSQAVQAQGQAGNLLDDSRKTNFSTNVAPHLTNTNATANGTAAATTSSGSSASSMERGESINPFENAAAQWQSNISSEQAAKQRTGASLLGYGAYRKAKSGGNMYGDGSY